MERYWRAILDWASWWCCGGAVVLVVARPTSRSHSSACRARSGAVTLAVWQWLLYVIPNERKSASVTIFAIFTFHRSLPLTSTVSWIDAPPLEVFVGISTSNKAFCFTATDHLVLTVETLFALELKVTRSCQWAGRCRGCLVWGVLCLGHGRATTDLVA